MKNNTESAKFSHIYKMCDELYHNVALKYGLSDTTLWTLYLLCRADKPYTQNQLAEELHIPKQTVNSSIAKMIKEGYVELTQIPGPRNNKEVCLTKYGEEYCNEYVLPLLEAENRAISRMTEDERKIFITLFEKRYQFLKEEVEILLK